MLIFRATSLKYCYLHVLNFYLDNGVMTTPKRRILSFVFTVLSNMTIYSKIFQKYYVSTFQISKLTISIN